jgi:aryl-alcohol dehydrogenase-like predicted oxidoreductase
MPWRTWLRRARSAQLGSVILALSACAAPIRPCRTHQVLYSLADRKIETDGTLETARELGITITAYTPLGSGLLQVNTIKILIC